MTSCRKCSISIIIEESCGIADGACWAPRDVTAGAGVPFESLRGAGHVCVEEIRNMVCWEIPNGRISVM